MADPFQNVSAASPEMVGIIVDALEARAIDPQMLPIIDAYIARLDWPAGGLLLEIGAGTGGVSRRVAAHYTAGRVHGVEPSADLVAEARKRAAGLGNLSFAVGDGAALTEADDSADIALLHTVLSHVTNPAALVAEAFRVLRPGGQLVVCDADFSKLSLDSAPGDPLQACAICVQENFVTNPWLTADLRGMVARTGFEPVSFTMANRLDLGGGGGLAWMRMATAFLHGAGIIGEELSRALLQEYHRRSDAGILYGFLPFATLIARKPAG